MLSRCFLDFSVSVGAFVIGLSQISSFFSCYSNKTFMAYFNFNYATVFKRNASMVIFVRVSVRPSTMNIFDFFSRAS